ncbi:hypothetical protein D3248_12700 [Leucobacter zeae]|nr:hypothetical protein [Leucobacter zeae]
MTEWAAFALPVLAAVATITILGLPIALALGLRGFAAPLVTVPAAFAVLAVSSIAADLTGVPWSLLPPLALSAVLAVALFALRRWIGAGRGAAPRAGRAVDETRRGLLVTLGAAAIGGAAIAALLAAGIRSPGAVSQTFDAGFHLNAVRYILDSGTASPLAMELTSPGSASFYPTLWHGFTALVVQLCAPLGGFVTIPVATNAVLFTTTAVVWPIGVVALGRAIAGPSTRVAVVSGALATAFPNFPLYLSGYGVLYPNVLALALMPYVLVAGLRILDLGAARRAIPLRGAATWLLFLGALGAAVLAHPNVIHALVVWGAFPVLAAAIRAVLGRRVTGRSGAREPARLPRWARALLAVLGVVAYAGAAAAAWITGRTSDNAWMGRYYPRDAVGQILDSTPGLVGGAWAVSALIVLGAVIAWRTPRLRWAIGSAAGLALLYFVADGFPTSDWRTLITGPWYNDPRRLAALIPFGAIPLAVLSGSAAWAMLGPGLRRFASMRATRPVLRTRVLAACTVVLLIAVGQAGAQPAREKLRESYDVGLAVVLSDDELALLDRLDESVPEGDRIANNPLNGSGLGYALADREVLFPHAGGSYDPRSYELVSSLVPEPERACTLADELDVDFVLDFGQDFIFKDDPRREKPFEEMHDLDRSPILTEVDREGDARLFRIAC